MAAANCGIILCGFFLFVCFVLFCFLFFVFAFFTTRPWGRGRETYHNYEKGDCYHMVIFVFAPSKKKSPKTSCICYDSHIIS